MGGFQFLCLAIIALYLVVRIRHQPGPVRLLRRLFLLALASFVGEDTCIRAYGFYAYSPAWTPFVDRVPLVVVMIWPIVIHSAWDLARQLLGAGHRLVPLLGGGIVLADAALIEPIAVAAGLWWWTEPGLFGVPPIGVLGWGFFGTTAIALLERAEGTGRLAPELGVVVLTPLTTHVLLVVAWWGALRWVNGPVPSVVAATTVWVLSVGVAVIAWRRRLRDHVLLDLILVRVPPALLFFGLLGRYGRESAALVAWGLAFAPPYLALVPWRSRRRDGNPERVPIPSRDGTRRDRAVP